ncbi:tripartite tricarboxylate transporter TctB family protein [Rhizobium sp. BK376]|uniref:tripartite tricarboxylate transporter TctB family protein n=1 Tax=Rhizobium sp. BK376 TaxID=2512149 RepID=UPI001048D632|nr:tripartite tricarboxylate transporter TctB family protein [Rhizobium sp. BK376]TCR87714.1 tripartite tricarboxylate transporter TctB family protein [Rhizobium sp. BK376]
MTLKNISFSTFLTAVMLVIFSVMVGLAFGFPAKARFMPLIVGIPGMALCLLQLGMDLYSHKASSSHGRHHHVPTQAPAAAAALAVQEADPELPEFGPHTVPQEMAMWGYFISFIVAILLFGFYVSAPIMLAATLRTQAKKSWKFSLLLAVIATAVLYLVFGAFLGIELHEGFATKWLMQRFQNGAL